MQRLALIAATFLACAQTLVGEQRLEFPKQKPAFTAAFPDTWVFDRADQPSLFARSVAPEDESVALELLALDARQPDKALTESAKVLAKDFARLKTEAADNATINGRKVQFFRATGENDDGGATVIRCALFQMSDIGNYFMLSLTCQPKEEKRHLDDLMRILATVKGIAIGKRDEIQASPTTGTSGLSKPLEKKLGKFGRKYNLYIKK